MADQENWKRKYTELTREMEQRQQGDVRYQEQLASLIEYLSLGLEGTSSSLDADLQKLGSALKQQDQNQVPSIVRQIKKEVGQLDMERQHSRELLARILHRWTQQLLRANPAPSVSNLITSIDDRVPQAAEHLYSLSELISELVEIQGSMLNAPAQPKTDQDFELNSDHDRDIEMLRAAVASELLQILELLPVPAEGVERARALVIELEEGLHLERLPELMSSLVELVRLANGNTQEDFENYLLTLNSQLTFVQQFLEESRSDEMSAVQTHHQLDRQVRRDVRNIHRSVKESEDLDTLKQSVSQQLASIVRAMDSYRQQEQERESRLNRRYDDLLHKVEQMELETSKVKARMQEEQLRARTDPLTGLPNRTAYDQHLNSEYDRWERYGTGFSLAVGDIDFFKRINDQLGHLAGDRVLRLVAKVLKHNLRSTDFIARYGGEEFVILFPSTGAQEAYQATEKLRTAIADSPFNFKGERVEVTLSFGVAEVHQGDDPEGLFTRADQALYLAKQQGRNQTQGAGKG
ncbi:diguanylate cyclase [Marinobacterium sp. AK62]|uniref:diguanylate cyclase n=1 Tax=Marinobacterium alkalitolerans TaxID=1542925 RepID=A0ABS3ZEL2_9GAMM|nr:GGDEF domain-containing protein [Marinobacterium alkalitolerans]MBP0049469.1 diguanylate cyclase [Marinobacterium alkalitolerans]